MVGVACDGWATLDLDDMIRVPAGPRRPRHPPVRGDRHSLVPGGKSGAARACPTHLGDRPRVTAL
jgi:hypothetical protein